MATSNIRQLASAFQQFTAGLSDEEKAKILEIYVSSVFQAAVDRGLPTYEAMPPEHSHRLFLWMAERLTDSLLDPDKLDVDQAARELLHYYGRMLLEPWREKLTAPTMPTAHGDQAAPAGEVQPAPRRKGRQTDPWNAAAIQRLLDGMPEDEARALWRNEYPNSEFNATPERDMWNKNVISKPALKNWREKYRKK